MRTFYTLAEFSKNKKFRKYLEETYSDQLKVNNIDSLRERLNPNNIFQYNEKGEVVGIAEDVMDGVSEEEKRKIKNLKDKYIRGGFLSKTGKVNEFRPLDKNFLKTNPERNLQGNTNLDPLQKNYSGREIFKNLLNRKKVLDDPKASKTLKKLYEFSPAEQRFYNENLMRSKNLNPSKDFYKAKELGLNLVEETPMSNKDYEDLLKLQNGIPKKSNRKVKVNEGFDFLSEKEKEIKSGVPKKERKIIEVSDEEWDRLTNKDSKKAIPKSKSSIQPFVRKKKQIIEAAIPLPQSEIKKEVIKPKTLGNLTTVPQNVVTKGGGGVGIGKAVTIGGLAALGLLGTIGIVKKIANDKKKKDKTKVRSYTRKGKLVKSHIRKYD